MLPILLLLFILVPIAELAVIIQVGQVIGVVPTIAILVADSVIGSALMRSQGRAAWRRFNEAVAGGRPPAREVIDGVLVIFGGALLLTPGFITDVFGVLFLLPPTRALLRRLLVRRAAIRIMGGAMPPQSGPSRNGRPHDVEATAWDAEPDQLDPPPSPR
jgi:UPF0716 protein FxsA